MIFEQWMQPVSFQEIETQARRQAKLRLPRKGEPKEVSATYTGNGFIRLAKKRPYYKVWMPIVLLTISSEDICEERQARLKKIKGTNDPIWVRIFHENGKPLYEVQDGNNRVYYAKMQRQTHLWAYVWTDKDGDLDVLYKMIQK